MGAQRGVRCGRHLLRGVLLRPGGRADHPFARVFGLWEVGTSMYTAIVIIINLQMGQMINYWTWLHYVAIFGSIVIWYVCNVILSNTDPYLSTYSYKIFIPTVAPTPKYWAATPFVVALGLLPDLVYRGAVRAFRPEPHHIVQEYERRDKRLRGERRERSALARGDGVRNIEDRDVEAAELSSSPSRATRPFVPGRAAAAASQGAIVRVRDGARGVGRRGEPGASGPGHRRRASAEKMTWDSSADRSRRTRGCAGRWRVRTSVHPGEDSERRSAAEVRGGGGLRRGKNVLGRVQRGRGRGGEVDARRRRPSPREETKSPVDVHELLLPAIAFSAQKPLPLSLSLSLSPLSPFLFV